MGLACLPIWKPDTWILLPNTWILWVVDMIDNTLLFVSGFGIRCLLWFQILHISWTMFPCHTSFSKGDKPMDVSKAWLDCWPCHIPRHRNHFIWGFNNGLWNHRQEVPCRLCCTVVVETKVFPGGLRWNLTVSSTEVSKSNNQRG